MVRDGLYAARKAKLHSAFDADSCRKSLTHARSSVDLYVEDAELIRLGENAIFHLRREGLVARIARGLEVLADARKELDVANWLLSVGLDTAKPAPFAQPIVVDERPITFWQFIESDGTEPTIQHLGTTLRALHRLDPPGSLELPAHDMFARVDSRIEHATRIPEADREFLRSRSYELRHHFSALSFPLPLSAIHGDAHVGNLLQRRGDGVALIDLERFAFGHPETDLSVTAIEHRIGWFTDSQYSEFVQAYGFDVTAWDGFTVLQAIGELKMTTWLMQNVGHSPAIDDEIQQRLNDLRNPDKPRAWRPF